MTSKILLISNIGFTITNFRSELLDSLSRKGFDVTIACPSTGDFNEALAETPYAHREFELSRGGINPIADLRTLAQLYRIMKKEQPQIVLNYTIKPTIYASIAARLAGVPNVYSTITGLGFVFTGNSLKHALIRFVVSIQFKLALGLNRRVFFQNKDDRDEFLSRKLLQPNKVVIVNGSGVNLDRFNRETPINIRNPTFLFVGRLLIDKGIREFVTAARIVKEAFPEAIFRVVGGIDANPMGLSIKEIDEWRESGVIEHTEFVEDIKPCLEEATVFVLPSYREGTPRSSLEALAMSMPIITTDAPGCRETVEDGRNGFLVPVKNSQAIAEKMVYFLENPDLVESMGKESLKLAISKYNVHLVNEKVIATIEDADRST